MTNDMHPPPEAPKSSKSVRTSLLFLGGSLAFKPHRRLLDRLLDHKPCENGLRGRGPDNFHFGGTIFPFRFPQNRYTGYVCLNENGP